ncbi:hypothetical protein SAMN06297468_0084 [Altererythrobacter xiamenensis]|uniref:Uncharacterized protein n=1 Tax=Altererythrobacter xiamenensis TaxID=1316679 RepID=A0A1Y6E595_9SPHN|nr:hypothetical protein [Altererythrobacter xiamenensis]SMQ57938.1 hypothetical protein SAMN06297468_0084 [Altererythrobacter xiamenensis]
MSDKTDPTKPIPNDEKFKPQNVADPKKGGNPTNQHRSKPGDTGGNDLSQGSEGVTKKTPSA